jgi:hypothetical protein
LWMKSKPSSRKGNQESPTSKKKSNEHEVNN